MSTYEKVLETLDEIKKKYAKDPETRYAFAVIIAQEACRKQVPEKPNDVRFVQEGDLRRGRCPGCLHSVDEDESFCWNCGQALRW